MDEDKGHSKPDDPASKEAERTEDAGGAAKDTALEEEELEEGLEESMDGSEAPASTRRSDKK